MLQRSTSMTSLISDITFDDDDYSTTSADKATSFQGSLDDLLKHETILPVEGEDDISYHTVTEASDTYASANISSFSIENDLFNMRVDDIWDLHSGNSSCELIVSKTIFSLSGQERNLLEFVEVSRTTVPDFVTIPQNISSKPNKSDSIHEICLDKSYEIASTGKRKLEESKPLLRCVSNNDVTQENRLRVFSSPFSNKRQRCCHEMSILIQ